MKKYFFFIITLSSISNIFSQRTFSIGDDTRYIDSIANIVKTTKIDSIKCMYSYRLSKLYMVTNDSKNAHFYLDKANNLVNKFPYLKAESTYFNIPPTLENEDYEAYIKSLLKTNEDLKKYKIPSAYKVRVIVLQNYALALQDEGRESEAMSIMISKAIPLTLKSQDDEATCHVYKFIGVSLANADQREKAEYYLNLAQFYVERCKKVSPTLLENKVETYILHAENLIEIKKYKNAKIIMNKISLILSKYPESRFNITFAMVEGLYNDKLGNYDKAIEKFNIGIKTSTFSDDLLGSNRLKTGKYEVLIKQKKYNEAVIVIEDLLQLATYPDDIKAHYRALSKTYDKIGNSKKAFFYSEKYINLNDSLDNAQFKDKVATLEAKFYKTENEKKISQLLAQKEKAQLVAKNNQLNILLLGLLASISLISIFIIWKYFKNQKKQKEIDFNQKIESLENKKNLDVSNALLQGEEVERKRLARDLHDGLGSMLSGLKLYYSGTKKTNENEFQQVNLQLDNSIKELRQIAQNLMPESLLKLGLIAALKDLCFRFSTDKTIIEFQEFGIQNTISESKQITIYRIIQELINNAMKYANATEILVHCSQNENTFLITVEDNGQGFDSKRANLFDGMGLKNIKNRVDFLKGELEIDSQPQTGTVFNIELNVFEEQKIVENA